MNLIKVILSIIIIIILFVLLKSISMT